MTAAAIRNDHRVINATAELRLAYPQLCRHGAIEGPDHVGTVAARCEMLGPDPRAAAARILAEMETLGLYTIEGDGAYLPAHARRPRLTAQTADLPGVSTSDPKVRAAWRTRLSRDHRNDPRLADPIFVAELWALHLRGYAPRRRPSEGVTTPPTTPPVVTPSASGEGSASSPDRDAKAPEITGDSARTEGAAPGALVTPSPVTRPPAVPRSSHPTPPKGGGNGKDGAGATARRDAPPPSRPKGHRSAEELAALDDAKLGAEALKILSRRMSLFTSLGVVGRAALGQAVRALALDELALRVIEWHWRDEAAAVRALFADDPTMKANGHLDTSSLLHGGLERAHRAAQTWWHSLSPTRRDWYLRGCPRETPRLTQVPDNDPTVVTPPALAPASEELGPGLAKTGEKAPATAQAV